MQELAKALQIQKIVRNAMEYKHRAKHAVDVPAASYRSAQTTNADREPPES